MYAYYFRKDAKPVYSICSIPFPRDYSRKLESSRYCGR
jgi:hypothetical protein